MKAKVTEIEDLNTQLAALKTPESTTPDAGTTTAASATTEAIEALKQQVVAAELEKNLLAEKLDSVQTQMVTLQREAQRREQGVMARGLQGTILAVNPAWNFVVLSLGDRQGVANNAEMIVRRGGRLVGRVRVTSVERTNSIADIVPGSVPTGVTIQPGDVVIFAGAAATES